jgi:acyl-coenzyme A thioesterase PaaI-like protein
MDSVRTHAGIDPSLSGLPRLLEPGHAVVEMVAVDVMRADARGLVHGGFVFSLADHAAMLAINQPTVVLGAAQVRFLAPVIVGDILVADARAAEVDGKKNPVAVTVRCRDQTVFEGSFTCFVPSGHVLD